MHDVMMSGAFAICMTVGGGLGLLSMTALATEGKQADGMFVTTVTMALLFMFGLAGYLRMLPWT